MDISDDPKHTINISDPIIRVQQGKVKGVVCENVRGGKYYAFFGIPYGKAPVGDLRFKAPVAVDPWPEVFDATTVGNMSVQENFLTKQIDGCEDCLNLNIYTPQLPNSNRSRSSLKPVMVYIHGGSFLSGSNRKELYGPDVLINEDVVIVAMNYRLGILGFLSLEDATLDVPGNAAFKDMVLALKWVQNNITNFMGNPKNVTVFGNSAGAASVHFLVLSPMAKGLFHKALCQSGSALSSWAYAHPNAKPLATALGLRNVNDKELYAYLKNASVEEIFEAQRKIDKEAIKGNRFQFVGAVIEPPAWRGAKFFSKHPIKLLLSGKYNKVPMLMGYNSGDGMITDGMLHPSKNFIYWTETEYNVPALLYLEKGSTLSKQLGDEIVSFYFGKGDISRETHLSEFYEITTHNLFLRGILSSIRHHRRTSNTPLYMYRLSIESDLCFYKKLIGVKLPGVCHADEIGYLFSTIFTETPPAGTIEDITQRRMSRMWTNFARYGNPTPFNDPLLDIVWNPVIDEIRIPFLDICEDLRMEYNPEHEKMRFWDKIYSNGKLTSKL